MTRFTRLLPMVVVAVAALAGCNHPTETETAASSTTTARASAPAVPVAAATTALPVDHATTKRYRIDITYPRLPASEAVLTAALHQAGTRAKREFLQGLPDPGKHPEFAGRQMLLKLDFSVAARMPAFVSVRERGMAATGGAHPIPVEASFVYATDAGKVIALDDLFIDPKAARRRLATLARKALTDELLTDVPGGARTPPDVRKEWLHNMRQMIDEGTRPTRDNYSQFVVLAGAGDQASGLLLIFPPYQVAPYVYGTQTVQVPVTAFADLLKPAYRDDFDTAE